jgi:hypothetical protein
MKNAPVVVIRNRDANIPEKYRIRNLLTNQISYSNSVTLANPQYIDNVDSMPNLAPEQVVRCNWAISGNITSLDALRKLSNKTPVETDIFGFTFTGSSSYFESQHGSLKALHFGEKSGKRFVWLKTALKK